MVRSRAIRLAALGTVCLAGPAAALEPADLQPILQSMPPDLLAYESQTVDADGRVVFDQVTMDIPEFGVVTAERFAVGDLDLASIMSGDAPQWLDIEINGLLIEQGAYESDMRWPFAQDSLSADIVLNYRIDDGVPGSIEGHAVYDFGPDGMLAIDVRMEQPDWYPDTSGAERQPEVGERVLPTLFSVTMTDFELPAELFYIALGQLMDVGDISIDMNMTYTASLETGDVEVSGEFASNQGQMVFAASGMYGDEMQNEFGPQMRSYETFVDFIEWQSASLTYRDAGLVDTVLELAMAASGKPAFLVVADGLEALGEMANDLGSPDGSAADMLSVAREMLLGFGAYRDDEVALTFDPVVPVSFATLGDVRVDPGSGLHPDDMIALLGMWLVYSPQ